VAGQLATLRTPRGIATAAAAGRAGAAASFHQAFDQTLPPLGRHQLVIWAIAAVSLNMILGYGGLVSFGHAVFFGNRRLCRRHFGLTASPAAGAVARRHRRRGAVAALVAPCRSHARRLFHHDHLGLRPAVYYVAAGLEA